MWADVFNIAYGFVLAPASAYCWKLIWRFLGGRGRYRYVLGWMTGSICGDAAAIISRDWTFAIGATASAIVAFAVWLWRRHKDRRKRAAALIGAKSRALRDAIVKRAKESARGARPVLRPIPGSAP